MKNNIEIWLKRLVITTIIITMSSMPVLAGGGTPPPHAAPIAILKGPIYAYVGNDVILDGSDSYTGGIYYITQYDFDYGKGDGWQGWQAESTATTTYSTAGAYTAKLKVMDNASYTSSTVSKTVFVNGDERLSMVAVDEPFNHWVVNQNVNFDISVQVTNGGDAYWMNITQANIYKGFVPVLNTEMGGDHWNTTTDPLHAGGASHSFDYDGQWQTNEAGPYWIRVQCYDGNAPVWSDWHMFYVFSI